MKARSVPNGKATLPAEPLATTSPATVTDEAGMFEARPIATVAVSPGAAPNVSDESVRLPAPATPGARVPPLATVAAPTVPVPPSAPPLAMATPDAALIAPVTDSVPWDTVVAPVKVFVPPSVSVPAPVFARPAVVLPPKPVASKTLFPPVSSVAVVEFTSVRRPERSSVLPAPQRSVPPFIVTAPLGPRPPVAAWSTPAVIVVPPV